MDLSAPLHLQALERFLDVNRLLKEVEEAVHDPVQTIKYSWNDEDFDDDEILVDIDHRPDDKYIYDMSELTEDNIWLKHMLMSDSSDSSEDEEMTETDMRRILRRYKAMKKVTESIRHQSSQYSGYSTSILASSDVPFHLDPPDIDYSSVIEKRRKRVKKRRKEKTPPPPQLTIRDMIDALTTSMDTPLPEELIIENGKEDHNTLEKNKDEVPKRKAPAEVWKSVVEEAYIFSRKRKYKLELHSCKRAKICSEIERGTIKLQSIRPIKEEEEIITISDDQFEDQTFNIETDNSSNSEVVIENSTEQLELSPLSMDVEANDNNPGNAGIISHEGVVIIEVERDKSPTAPSKMIPIVNLEDIADVEEEINNRIKESVDETIEISEADILDQSEIVNKKKEEIAAALRILENKIRQEQTHAVPKEEIEFTEEDMLEDIIEDVITVEDLETPDVSEETFKFQEFTECQTGETTTKQSPAPVVKITTKTTEESSSKITEENKIKTTEESSSKTTDENKIKTTEESNSKTTEENKIKMTEESNSKTTEENKIKTTEESNSKTTEENKIEITEESNSKTTEEFNKIKTTEESNSKTTEENKIKTTEDKTVLAKKCLSDIVSSVPDIL